MVDLPKIGILTMAFNPINTIHAILNAAEQTYPYKKLYLLKQEPNIPLAYSCLNLEIEELFVRGKWPKLWAQKFVTGLNAVKEPIVAVMDEDDRFRSNYLEEGVDPILAGEADVTCNMSNIDCRKGWIGNDICSVGTGTLIGRTEVLRDMWNKYIAAGGVLVRMCNQGPVPADGPFFEFIANDPRMKPHVGIRYYFWHKDSQCKRHRSAKFAING